MNIKKIAAQFVLLFLFISLLSPIASANELTDGIFTYTVIEDAAHITACTSQYKYKLIIPKTIGGYSVKGIAPGAFYGNEYLTEIEFSEGIEIIGSHAFYMCQKLTRVTLPNGVSAIGENAFGQCSSLGEIFLPDSVESVGENAFASSMKIEVSGGNVGFSSDENGVLFNKHKSVLLQYPSNSEMKEYVVPQTVKKIGKRAFYQSENLERIELKNGLTTIGEEAFFESALTSVAIPKSVRELGKAAFSKCPLTMAKLSEAITEIPEKLFYLCTLLEKVKIGEKVKSIGDEAFFGCEKLSEFDIPTSVRDIGKGTFFGCKSLLKMSIPDGIQSIKDNTFYGTGLREIILPRSIKSIGYEAFSQCNELEKVIFNAPKAVWEEVFAGEHNDCLTESEIIFRDYDIDFSIKSPSSRSVKYGEILVLYIETDEIPKNSRIVWESSGDTAKIQQSKDGTACHVIPKKSGKTEILAMLLDESGNVAVNSVGKEMVSTQEIKVKVNIFRRAVSYVKDLFGLTRYVF